VKSNRFRQALSEKGMAVGHMITEFACRGTPHMLEVADLDFALIDCEHTGLGVGDVADLIGWFRATSVAPFVRVPQLQYHFIARTLDLGALGIMVPNVRNADEARAIVDAAKYAPLGKRGVGLGGANTDYRSVVPTEYIRSANQNTTVICQIESAEALDDLEAIASVPGVDVLWVGHFDLSQSMGIVGELDHPALLDALRRVARTAREHGLAAGVQPNSIEQTREWMELGFNVISCSNDKRLYSKALSSVAAEVRQNAP